MLKTKLISFYCIKRKKLNTLILLLLLINAFVFCKNGLSDKVSDINKKSKTENDEPMTISEELKLKSSPRFSETEYIFNNNESLSPFVLNTEHLYAKPLVSSTEHEIEVIPLSANSGTHFTYGSGMQSVSFPANKALTGFNSEYWMSKVHSIDDHWEAVFKFSQKLDSLMINWRFPPKRFKIYFKMEESERYIPLTDLIEKNIDPIINSKSSQVNYTDSFVFNKPIFAKRLRIAMNTPLIQETFSINRVKFYQKRTVMVIKNRSFNSLCFWVNSNNPVENDKVEISDCTEIIQMGLNKELWISFTDQTIRHYNSLLCLAYNKKFKLILKNCSSLLSLDKFNIDSPYKIIINSDGTLSFNNNDEKVIAIDTIQTMNDNGINYINPKTSEVITSSAFDDKVYNIRNILDESNQGYWLSNPNDTKANLIISFSKETDKKVDIIHLNWFNQPKEYLIYKINKLGTRELIKKYSNQVGGKGLVSFNTPGGMFNKLEIEIEEMNHNEFGNNNCSLSLIKIIGFTTGLVVREKEKTPKNISQFEFDIQYNFIISNSHKLYDFSNKLSLSMNNLRNSFKKFIGNSTVMLKFKNKYDSIKNKLSVAEEYITNNAFSNLKDFINSVNPYNPANKDRNLSIFERQYSNSHIIYGDFKTNIQFSRIGTKSNPAENCQHIYNMDSFSPSGFYYIKTECSPEAIRVHCEFNYSEQINNNVNSLDFYIETNDSINPDSDLSNLDIHDYIDVRIACAKRGLEPLEINSNITIQKIVSVLKKLGYKLSDSKVIPLGYDYSCNLDGCSKLFFSLNNKDTIPLNSLGNCRNNSFESANINNFIGLTEFSLNPRLLDNYDDYQNVPLYKYNSYKNKLSGLICSTNIKDQSDSALRLSCEANLFMYSELLSINKSLLINCPSRCNIIEGDIFGFERYHASSLICKAAFHSGKLESCGGKVYINILPPLKYEEGLKTYDSFENFKIVSKTHDIDEAYSFSFSKYTPECPLNNLLNLRKITPKSSSKLFNLPKIENFNSWTSFLEKSIIENSSKSIKENVKINDHDNYNDKKTSINKNENKTMKIMEDKMSSQNLNKLKNKEFKIVKEVKEVNEIKKVNKVEKVNEEEQNKNNTNLQNIILNEILDLVNIENILESKNLIIKSESLDILSNNDLKEKCLNRANLERIKNKRYLENIELLNLINSVKKLKELEEIIKDCKSNEIRFTQINPNNVVRRAAVEGIEKAIKKKIENGMLNLFGMNRNENGEVVDSVSLNGALSGDAVMAAEALGLGDAARKGLLGGSAIDDELHKSFNIGIGPNGTLTLGGPGKPGQIWGERGQNALGPNLEINHGIHTGIHGPLGNPAFASEYRTFGNALEAEHKNAEIKALSKFNPAADTIISNPETGRLGVGSGLYPGLSNTQNASPIAAMGPGKGAVDLYSTPGHYDPGKKEYNPTHDGGAFQMGSSYGYGKGGMSAFVSLYLLRLIIRIQPHQWNLKMNKLIKVFLHQ